MTQEKCHNKKCFRNLGSDISGQSCTAKQCAYS